MEEWKIVDMGYNFWGTMVIHHTGTKKVIIGPYIRPQDLGEERCREIAERHAREGRHIPVVLDTAERPASTFENGKYLPKFPGYVRRSEYYFPPSFRVENEDSIPPSVPWYMFVRHYRKCPQLHLPTTHPGYTLWEIKNKLGPQTWEWYSKTDAYQERVQFWKQLREQDNKEGENA